jgi:hypothetical protein
VRPSEDAFYAEVGVAAAPGVPVRVRPVGLACDRPVAAWQVVHGSLDSLGRANAVSGTLLVPDEPWARPGPRPVLTYGVGVHGLDRDCAPSFLLREGREYELPLIELALRQGWAVAVSDGEGLGMPGPHTYGAGRAGGHALLDAARAAAHVVPGVTPQSPVLVWGYSEGGRNAAWAGELQPSHAPELPLVGVAAGGVPADLRETGLSLDGGPFSGLNLAVVVGLAHASRQPAILAVLNDSGRAAAAHAATLDVVGLVLEHAGPMRGHTRSDDPWNEPAWKAALARERNGGTRPEVPVYLYHVTGDELVPEAVGRTLAADYRRLGADVTWADVRADDHLGGAAAGAGDAIAWLAARLPELPPAPVDAAARRAGDGRGALAGW